MKDNTSIAHLEGASLQIGYGDHVIVSDMDVEIRNDRITTIIGPNGSGKSTVLKAITRLIRYQKGTVLLNGRDILEMKPKEFARTIGVLPQVHSAPADFRVKELVSYGRMPHQKLLSGVSGEDERIIKWAMEATSTWQFRDKSIFEISGGERQRISIARALLHNPRILILDEATSALDTETEKLIQDALLSLSRGRTTIAIAHRLSTLRNATRLVVMDRGTIAEVGTHEELMAKEGIYYGLVMAQREMTKID